MYVILNSSNVGMFDFTFLSSYIPYLILLFILVITVSWLIFLAYGYAPLGALFEVVSAAGTVGLSSGITSSELEAALKVVLCVNMLLGRLEIIALLVVLYPSTWIGKRTE